MASLRESRFQTEMFTKLTSSSLRHKLHFNGFPFSWIEEKKLWKYLLINYKNKKNNKNNHENRDYKYLKKLSWIPNISPKIKRELIKTEKDIAFTAGKSSTTNSLSKNNKPKLLPNSQPGVYQLDCLCNGKYIGKSKIEGSYTMHRTSTG